MKRICSLAGEMAARISNFNWGQTTLGTIETWPQHFITALGMVLSSRFPMQLLWGSEYIHFYNDAYIPIAADKHAYALGSPGATIWPERWQHMRPLLDRVRATGHVAWMDNKQVLLKRNDQLEEGYVTFSYGPIWGNIGVDGICVTVEETTWQVIPARRCQVVHELATTIAKAQTEASVCLSAAEVLTRYPADLSFALIYLAAQSEGELDLKATVQLAAGHPAAPRRAGLHSGPWPFADVLATEQPVLTTHIPPTLGALPGGIWNIPATAALTIPLRSGDKCLPIGYLVVGISPRLRFDEAYYTFLEQISSQIADRIVDLRSDVLAQETVHLRDDFLSIVAHEIKGPLTPLIGRLQMLERRMQRAGIDDQYIDLVKLSTSDARRIVNMIDTLFEIPQLRDGKLTISRTVFNLTELILQIITEIEPSLISHWFEVEAPRCPTLISGNALWMTQMIRNLLANAVKYSPNGGAVTVRLTVADGQVALAVSDQGIGIPEDARARIFERYYRAGNVNDFPTSGLGIGLFVVYEVVRLHDGRVEVQSALGMGSTFIVLLPLTENL